MTYYECVECGQLGTFVGIEGRRVTMECPVCEGATAWEIAFVDEEGVSF